MFESDSCTTLCGKTVWFTGELSTLFRKDAESLVVSEGGICKSTVTSRTNILVVGTQDLVRTKGSEKSSKHMKAESINKTGKKIISIIDESEFMRLLGER
jgi:DNA polymerase-3 subunit epsilon